MLTIIVLYTEMYSEIAFDFHVHDDPQSELDKIDLPSPVKAVEMSGRPEKLYFLWPGGMLCHKKYNTDVCIPQLIGIYEISLTSWSWASTNSFMW